MTASRLVDERLYLLVAWEVSMGRWSRRAGRVLGTYCFFLVAGMACAPFVVVAAVYGDLWVIWAVLALGGGMALLPALVSLYYRLRISRLRSTLS